MVGWESGAPGAIPTRDLPLRRRTLYAAELREHEQEPEYRSQKADARWQKAAASAA
jgi:hypothetical protein